MRTYTATKLLTGMFTNELARRLAGSGVVANTADPGFVRTALGRDAPGGLGVFLNLIRPFQLSPDKAAETPVHLATAASAAETSGGYSAKCRPRTPSVFARDADAGTQMWNLSTDLTTAFTTRRASR